MHHLLSYIGLSYVDDKLSIFGAPRWGSNPNVGFSRLATLSLANHQSPSQTFEIDRGDNDTSAATVITLTPRCEFSNISNIKYTNVVVMGCPHCGDAFPASS